MLAAVAKSFYYDMIYSADVHYLNIINYSFGKANGLLFLYFFSGTFLVFMVSILLRYVVRSRYVELLKRIMLSLSPVLLFGWIPSFMGALLVWSSVLFIVGAKDS